MTRKSCTKQAGSCTLYVGKTLIPQSPTNNPYVQYTYISPHNAPKTILIHIATPDRPTQKQKRHNRAINILPDATRIITLPPSTSAFHQQLTLITATHLVITTPQPRDNPWYIFHPLNTTATILHRILAKNLPPHNISPLDNDIH